MWNLFQYCCFAFVDFIFKKLFETKKRIYLLLVIKKVLTFARKYIVNSQFS